MPDFFRFLSSALRAGLSVRQSVMEASARTEGPLAGELKKVSAEIANGLSLEESFRGLAERSGSREAAAAAAVLTAAVVYGGDSPGALDGMADIAAAHREIRQEIRVLTAQARFSALILGVLPVGFLIFNPAGAGLLKVLTEPYAAAAVGLGALLNAAGFIALRRLADPDRL
jgi:tight adherence protein B